MTLYPLKDLSDNILDINKSEQDIKNEIITNRIIKKYQLMD
jgi:hypothetical protein